MYIIEGNIGAGKSTFLKLLESRLPELTVALEPIAHWQNSEQGQSLLEQFYLQPKRWAYSLETMIMMSRITQHQKYQQVNKNIIVERSIYSGHHCFAQNSYANGFMTTVEWQMYTHIFNFLAPQSCKAPLGFIYMKVDPEVAFERIKKRDRQQEKTITRHYLDQIHNRHESFLIQDKKNLPSIGITPVLTLDCNKEFETDNNQLEMHIDALKQFISDTQNTFKPARADWQMLRRAPAIDDELFTI